MSTHLTRYQPSNKTLVLLCFILSLIALLESESLCAEPSLADTVAKIKPSIVAIGTYMPRRNPRSIFMATGFAVGDGSLIITNAHAIPETLDIEHLEKIAIFYHKDNIDKVVFATELAIDKDHDLALLKISDERLPAVTLGSAASVREGQLYAFTGFPIGMVLGLYPVTHRGLISAITPNIIPMINSTQIKQAQFKRLQNPYSVFQLDATAYPGNSGSPLYHPESGQVIGVINKVFVQESKENILAKPSGISYAIPINYVENLLKVKGYY